MGACEHLDALDEPASWREDIGWHLLCRECTTYLELDGSLL